MSASDMSSFWDTIHQTRFVPMLGDTTFEDYVDYFSLAGPFKRDLERASSVLDVGPGLGAFLKALPPTISRYAVEVSEVNRIKLLSDRVASWPPSVIATCKAPPFADLATCVSVFQHCNGAMVTTLLTDVAAALREGKALYANGIVNGTSRTRTDKENTENGSHSHELRFMQALCGQVGLVVTNTHSYKLETPQIDVWVLRAVLDLQCRSKGS